MSITIPVVGTAELSIDPREYYSSASVEVLHDQTYSVNVPEGERWKDLFYTTTARGFFNPLAWLQGMRLKGVKCFCLCCVYNERGAHGFQDRLVSRVHRTE